MIIGLQVKLGRVALGWSIEKLAKSAGLGWATVQRMERAGADVPGGYSKNLEAVQAALERAGIMFLDDDGSGPGVRVKV